MKYALPDCFLKRINLGPTKPEYLSRAISMSGLVYVHSDNSLHDSRRTQLLRSCPFRSFLFRSMLYYGEQKVLALSNIAK